MLGDFNFMSNFFLMLAIQKLYCFYVFYIILSKESDLNFNNYTIFFKQLLTKGRKYTNKHR